MTMHKAYITKEHIEKYDQKHFGGRVGELIFNQECCVIDNFLDSSSGLFLDVPCGTGIYSSRFRKIGYKVIAADNSFPMLEIANARDDELNRLNSDVFYLPFPENCIDIILTVRLFQHFQKSMVLKILSELNRVMKPNGKLVFDTFRWSPKQMRFISRFFEGEMYVLSLDDVEELIQSSGFEKIDSKSLHLYSPIRQRKLPYWFYLRINSLEKLLPQSWLLRTFWVCTKY